jgi:hypothetical protein
MFAGLYAAVTKTFPETRVFPVNEPENTKILQNIVLVASKTKTAPAAYQEYRSVVRQASAFTDNFAPVEWKTMRMVKGK